MFNGCTDASIASSNLSRAADMFQLDRRIVFYNGITSEYILTIEGKCSVQSNQHKLAVTCKVSDNKFKKHFLGISDNVTWFSEQLESKNVSTYHYKVIFKHQTIIPDMDFKYSTTDTPLNQ
jgi:hypothetical protein